MAEARAQVEEIRALRAIVRTLTAAAAQVVESQWQHRCPDGVGGCAAVSYSALEHLRDVLQDAGARALGAVPRA